MTISEKAIDSYNRYKEELRKEFIKNTKYITAKTLGINLEDSDIEFNEYNQAIFSIDNIRFNVSESPSDRKYKIYFWQGTGWCQITDLVDFGEKLIKENMS